MSCAQVVTGTGEVWDPASVVIRVFCDLRIRVDDSAIRDDWTAARFPCEPRGASTSKHPLQHRLRRESVGDTVRVSSGRKCASVCVNVLDHARRESP